MMKPFFEIKYLELTWYDQNTLTNVTESLVPLDVEYDENRKLFLTETTIYPKIVGVKKGILAIAGIAAIAIIAKKAQKRKAFVKGIFDEYDVKERTPFGFADKIRTMNDEEYNSLKEKVRTQFGRGCCK